MTCEITTDSCAVGALVASRDTNIEKTQAVYRAVQKARETGDVSSYDELLKMANSLESAAERWQDQINAGACKSCPFRT